MNRVGTVEVLRFRAFNTERGEYAVEPGTYPVFWDARAERYSVLLEGRSTQWTDAWTESLGDRLFTLHPAGDRLSGPVVKFPYGYWTRPSFADLLADPVCIEGDPMQRLRFNIDAEVPA